MKAIPTRYAGVNFRSRLEARWAAFFDLCNVEWEYEPVDLDGYIPDFILAFRDPILVEVKPIVRWPCIVDGCRDRGCFQDPMPRAAVSKILESGWAGDWILVGSRIEKVANYEGDALIGWGRGTLNGYGFQNSCFEVGWVPHRDHWTPFSHDGEWGCRNCRDPNDRKLYCSNSSDEVTSLWREAGNRVQWRAARA